MKRLLLKKKLLEFGYSEDMIKKLFQGKTKPTADKMFKLEDDFNIQVSIWRDIKSYIQENDTKDETSKSSANKMKKVS